MSGQEKPYWSRIEESIYLFKHVCLQAESHNDQFRNYSTILLSESIVTYNLKITTCVENWNTARVVILVDSNHRVITRFFKNIKNIIIRPFSALSLKNCGNKNFPKGLVPKLLINYDALN